MRIKIIIALTNHNLWKTLPLRERLQYCYQDRYYAILVYQISIEQV